MKKLNGIDFKAMLRSGAANLENYQNEINSLNVFPVPDGDTGTNMAMTFSNGCKEANNSLSNNVGDIAKSLSKGLLMGARGNSGVITSQIFRGIAQSIEEKETVDAKDLALAFDNGTRVAYKAIMKPVEGTILTVIREGSWFINDDVKKNPKLTIEEFFALLLEHCQSSLAKTPDLLPTLKEAGVVDSGGAGLCRIFEGFLAFLEGRPIETNVVSVELSNSAQMVFDNEEFGYCTEFILRLSTDYQRKFDENVLKNKLAEDGESLVLVKDDDLVKVHVHTLHPGEVLNLAQRYGEFIKIKIENMSEQHSMLIKQDDVINAKEEKEVGIIAVASGDGLCQLFKELGVDEIISGGQTMNPSTADFIDKIAELDHCRHIIILPNNSNIILAAEQAKAISEKDVTVIGTTSIQAALSLLSMYDPSDSAQDVVDLFEQNKDNVKVASVTYAVKDSNYEGSDVKEGDYLAMDKKNILATGNSLLETVYKLLDQLFEEKDRELLTIITGEGVKQEETDQIINYVNENGSFEIELIDGGQPVYYYLFGLE